ncbi:unnamed protein product [Tilletia laevis]|uniref:Vacuolar protein sorting-associated protein 27 n=2 Tax=Tilletia TaxID=13289 RepID=A0A9N8QAI0_9BASI|nr:hypothetical protein A4X03_0g5476 [Tilletia caries]CAD6886846.1 unnamed protein product [Tilletia caries]CAD6911002.1 unnamed protein product [Tilletia laevis]CAD6958772.1 unnamed protein product [Tilletia caries]CAD6965610.1 unnamed protein product [Tilletia laevis]
MASGWLSWGSDPFAELVEKATSELLPPNHEDVALNLEICDQIRAKQVQSKHAAQTIKRRLAHSNPNVVLLTLGLTDICIKNSGDHFLAEVGSVDFMDNLVSVLTAAAGPGKNVDVRNKLLRLIQSWAQVADARPAQMSYVAKTYADLKKRGFPFPPPEPSHVVSTALIETLTAPEWIDGDVCLRCRQPFTTFTRKHHCRNCGNVFCHTCSSNTMSLPWFGIGQDVRVCDGCHASRGPPSNARRAKPAPAPAPKTNDHVSSSSLLTRSSTLGAVRSSGRGGVGNAHLSPQRSNTITASSSTSRRKKEEDEIALAIQLSLQSSSNPSSGYVPSAPAFSAGPTPRSPARGPSGRIGEGTDTVREDDPELAAAIAASLRDYSVPQPSAPSGSSDFGSIASMPVTPAPQSEASVYDGGGYISKASSVAGPGEYYRQQYAQQAQAVAPPVPQSTLPLPPSIELPSQDLDALMSFSQTVVRAEEAAAQAPGHPYSIQQLHQTITDSRTQGLYERAQLARPKMARSLDEAGRRHNTLVGMHEKLTEAVKLYNRLLDAQMGRGPQIVYQQQQQQQQQQQGPPPPAPVRRETEQASYQQYGQVQSPGYSAPAQNGMYPSLPPSSAMGPMPPQAQQHTGYSTMGPGPISPQAQQHTGYGSMSSQAQQHTGYGSMYAAQSPTASFTPAYGVPYGGPGGQSPAPVGAGPSGYPAAGNINTSYAPPPPSFGLEATPAGGAGQTAGGGSQEPWRREDERPLIDL